MTKPIETLDQLYAVLTDPAYNGNADTNPDGYDAWQALGLPVARGEPDWTSLPTFGDSAPADTSGIWSWDDTRVIYGTCAEDIIIKPYLSPKGLKAARESLGLSQRDLGVLLGYEDTGNTRGQVNKMENGTRPILEPQRRLIEAYLAGYRPADWPKTKR